MSTKLQTLKGFRDFLPQKMTVRNEVIKRLRSVFEKYGFEELQTPALEYQEVLLGKYGEEAEKMMYLFKDQGGRGVGMKYDLTVPLARVASSYPGLPFPFKRYQIQPVWRAENTQKARYREFWQCDVDIVGSRSYLSDAEIITVIYESLTVLGFKDFRILINSRPLLYSMMEWAKIPSDKMRACAISIDKLDKNTPEDVKEEMIGKRGIDRGCVEELFRVSEIMKSMFPTSKNLTEGNVIKVPFDKMRDSLVPLKAIAKEANLLGVPYGVMVPRMTLARGLDYYTGIIFEAVVEKPKIGSIAGGGRYDKLLKTLGGPDLPAVGTTIGLDRVCDVIEELNLWQDMSRASTKVLVAVFSPNLLGQSIEIAKTLRDSGINTELYPDENTKLDKQLKYADRKGIPYVVIVGPEEIKEKKVVLKNLKTGEQNKVSQENIVSLIK